MKGSSPYTFINLANFIKQLLEKEHFVPGLPEMVQVLGDNAASIKTYHHDYMIHILVAQTSSLKDRVTIRIDSNIHGATNVAITTFVDTDDSFEVIELVNTITSLLAMVR